MGRMLSNWVVECHRNAGLFEGTAAESARAFSLSLLEGKMRKPRLPGGAVLTALLTDYEASISAGDVPHSPPFPAWGLAPFNFYNINKWMEEEYKVDNLVKGVL
jgi:hypothetical protein